jgi:hypothetical protein
MRKRIRLLAMHEVPRTLQRHKLKARAEEFLLPLEHLRPDAAIVRAADHARGQFDLRVQQGPALPFGQGARNGAVIRERGGQAYWIRERGLERPEIFFGKIPAR